MLVSSVYRPGNFILSASFINFDVESRSKHMTMLLSSLQCHYSGLIILASVLLACQLHDHTTTHAFIHNPSLTTPATTSTWWPSSHFKSVSSSSSLFVSRLDDATKIKTGPPGEDDDDDEGVNELLVVENPLYPRSRIPSQLRVSGTGIPNRKDKVQLVDTSTYEANLLERWEDNPDAYQKGFDWEIEKARRYFAGLRMREDGTWVRQPSLLDFLVSKQRVGNSYAGGPSPVNMLDVAKLFAVNILSSIGLGPALGLASVPNAVIQKYEGSFFSFIKGVLGGDLQTLAGGPLFLLLNKYFLEYGPIFNLSFGPKSFLVISDPVMARHILKTAPTDQYCKGMLAEILEPIMGKGLIPADPQTWRVSRSAFMLMVQHEHRRSL